MEHQLSLNVDKSVLLLENQRLKHHQSLKSHYVVLGSTKTHKRIRCHLHQRVIVHHKASYLSSPLVHSYFHNVDHFQSIALIHDQGYVLQSATTQIVLQLKQMKEIPTHNLAIKDVKDPKGY